MGVRRLARALPRLHPRAQGRQAAPAPNPDPDPDPPPGWELTRRGRGARRRWIGTGVMGAAMCSHLIKGGYAATVYNRTASKAQPLVDMGAKLATSPGEVAKNSDVVFTIGA